MNCTAATMALSPRGLRYLYSSRITPSLSQKLQLIESITSNGFICARCLSTSSQLQSGHNRWSKIKHDKAGVDAKKNKERSIFAHEIAMASKLFGPNPADNPKLATVLAAAKRAGFPKASMEAAVARGQGVSSTGAALESLTLEAIMPPNIAFVLDMETDNRRKMLADVRHLLKSNGATVTPTAYLFKRRGRVVFEKDERKLGVDEVLDEAIEAGAEDVEVDGDGNVVVWTDPSETKAAAEMLSKSLKLSTSSSDIIWAPNEDTMAPVDSPSTFEAVTRLADALADVNGVVTYSNLAQGEVDDESWSELQEKLAV